MIVGLCGLVSA